MVLSNGGQDEMRQRANWMNPVDDRIMELLADEGAGTPKSLADSIGHNNDYVGVRCRELAAYGLLRRPSRGLYLLSEDGEAYLEGDLDAADLEADEDATEHQPDGEAGRDRGTTRGSAGSPADDPVDGSGSDDSTGEPATDDSTDGPPTDDRRR